MVEHSASGRDVHGEELYDGAIDAVGDADFDGRLLDVFDCRSARAGTLHYQGKGA